MSSFLVTSRIKIISIKLAWIKCPHCLAAVEMNIGYIADNGQKCPACHKKVQDRSLEWSSAE